MILNFFIKNRAFNIAMYTLQKYYKNNCILKKHDI